MSGPGLQMSAVLVGALAITGIGVAGAALVQRRTWLSPWNWHLATAMLAALFSLAVWARARSADRRRARDVALDRRGRIGGEQPGAERGNGWRRRGARARAVASDGVDGLAGARDEAEGARRGPGRGDRRAALAGGPSVRAALDRRAPRASASRRGTPHPRARRDRIGEDGERRQDRAGTGADRPGAGACARPEGRRAVDRRPRLACERGR